MTIDQLFEKWRAAGGAERANKDLFLSDLCDVLGVERPHPTTEDETQDSCVFEKNVTRSREDGTSIGKIDLYRAGCFVLEAKQLDPGKRGTPAWEKVRVKGGAGRGCREIGDSLPIPRRASR